MVSKEIMEKLEFLAQQMWETVQGIEEIAPWEMPPFENADYQGELPPQLMISIWPDSINFLMSNREENKEKDGYFLINHIIRYDIEKEEWK